MQLSFGSPPSAFGLDLSDRSLKIAQFQQRRGQLAITLLHAFDLPAGLIVDGEITDVIKLGTVMAELLAPYAHDLANGVVASLPEPKTFVETIAVPKKDGTTLAEQLAATLPEYLPLPLQDVYNDTQVISETPSEWSILVGAAPKTVVDAYISLLDHLKLIPLALDVPAAAISRSIIPTDPPTAAKSRAIIDLGRRRASLMVHDHGTIQFTMSLPISGDEVTKNIAEQLKLTADQAEQAKVTCGLDPQKCEGVLKEVLSAMVAELVKRLTEAREFYQDRFPHGRPFDELMLCGGGAHLRELDTVLSGALHLPVLRANVWEHIKLTQPTTVNSPLQYTTAIGLALRSLEPETLL